jgi:hypothetical protein
MAMVVAYSHQAFVDGHWRFAILLGITCRKRTGSNIKESEIENEIRSEENEHDNKGLTVQRVRWLGTRLVRKHHGVRYLDLTVFLVEAGIRPNFILKANFAWGWPVEKMWRYESCLSRCTVPW